MLLVNILCLISVFTYILHSVPPFLIQGFIKKNQTLGFLLYFFYSQGVNNLKQLHRLLYTFCYPQAELIFCLILTCYQFLVNTLYHKCTLVVKQSNKKKFNLFFPKLNKIHQKFCSLLVYLLSCLYTENLFLASFGKQFSTHQVDCF